MNHVSGHGKKKKKTINMSWLIKYIPLIHCTLRSKPFGYDRNEWFFFSSRTAAGHDHDIMSAPDRNQQVGYSM